MVGSPKTMGLRKRLNFGFGGLLRNFHIDCWQLLIRFGRFRWVPFPPALVFLLFPRVLLAPSSGSQRRNGSQGGSKLLPVVRSSAWNRQNQWRAGSKKHNRIACFEATKIVGSYGSHGCSSPKNVIKSAGLLARFGDVLVIHLVIVSVSPMDCFCADFCFVCVFRLGISLSVEAWYTFGWIQTLQYLLASFALSFHFLLEMVP